MVLTKILQKFSKMSTPLLFRNPFKISHLLVYSTLPSDFELWNSKEVTLKKGKNRALHVFHPEVWTWFDTFCVSIYHVPHISIRQRELIAHNKSCGKVMFSQTCVKNSVHRGGVSKHAMGMGVYTPPLGKHSLGKHPTDDHWSGQYTSY